MPHECTNCGRVFADGSKEMLSGCPNCGGNKFQFRPSSASSADPGSEAANSGTSVETGDDRSVDGQNVNERNDPSTASTTWSETAKRALDDDAETPTEPKSPSDSPKGEDPANTARREASDSSERGPTDPAGRGETDSSRQWVNQRREDEQTESGRDPSETDDRSDRSASGSETAAEDTAQASARSDVVSPDELAAASAGRSSDGSHETDPRGPDGRPESDLDETAPANRDGPPTDAQGRVIEPSSDERPGLDELREELNEQFESIRIVAPGEYELNLMELYDRTEYIISLQEDGRYVIEVPDTWDTTPDDSNDA